MSAITPVMKVEEASSRRRIEALRGESVRLRTEMVRAELEICTTIVAFAEARPRSEALHTACQSTAAQGCGIIQRLLAATPAQGRSEFENRLRELQTRLALAGTTEYASPDRSKEPPPIPDSQSDDCGAATKDTLTRRELEVLKHIAEGHSTKQVASILGITFKTAACHRYHVMEKLNIHETANLVRYAIRLGLIQP